MSLVVWYDTSTTASDGTLVRDRLVAKVRNLIGDGNAGQDCCERRARSGSGAAGVDPGQDDRVLLV